MKKLTGLTGSMMLLLSGCAKESVSLGVIGGADGPTAVFVSAAPFWWVPLALTAAVIAAAIAVIAHRKKR